MPGQKKRFTVFKRDGFTCQYCGKTPPGVVLELDHIDPKSKGGGDEIANLVTACFDCNRGKGAVPLDVLPPKTAEMADKIREKKLQLKAFRKWKRAARKRLEADIAECCEHWLLITDTELTLAFQQASLRPFLSHLDVDDIRDFMSISAGRFPDDASRAVKYFCGCCWRSIRGETENG